MIHSYEVPGQADPRKSVMSTMGWGHQVSFSVGTESVGVTRMPQTAVVSVPNTPEVPSWKGWMV